MVTTLDVAGDIGSLQTVLKQAYDTMIRHCSELIGIGQAIAGFAALWYIGSRVWQHIAKAEPVQVYPLLRPFGIGIAIFLFPSVIGLINGVMQPTVSGTAALEANANQAVTVLLQQKQEALRQSNDWQMYVGPDGSGSVDKWEELSGDADSGVFSGISNRVRFQMAKAAYNMKNSVKVWLSEILQVLFESAALAINTIRTFYLIILAIFGPLAFGLCVFDGFGHIIRDWLARYINVFLWLPVANLFGTLISQIQQEMIRLDIAQVQASGQTSFGPTDTAYLVFLILSIAGYFTVPAVTNYIVSGGGIGLRRITGSIGIQN
ncbi:conjugative transposon protein TraJ [Flavitalea sp. BT771]|uniref:conjugative transposon protein TraJ n=1 Tax=Flavitalea sp. BT771 TaxID=3063329 RepID=UPI0026E36846|nr:conjugative transposon protein TraJ [Flavitalea sp. BT771]MDO6433280.1 conjugative transposon protein TraJ [Flavitalea sp. BT771]MDV6222815.1 conjugative transposon protein TraJ [Flavitalea sp. BT771]